VCGGPCLREHDVVVITQKVVSKVEGRAVRLSEVEPSAEAVELAAEVRKDPRFVELVLRESRGLWRCGPFAGGGNPSGHHLRQRGH